MADWVCIPCLLTLRSEFDLVNPKRDKGADGTIGDVNHSSTSDHTPDEQSAALRGKDADNKNEVHALDIDSTGPWPDGKGGEAGGWFDRKIHELIAEEKRRWLDPDDMCRLRYIIWRGYIYHIDNNFAPKVYTGSSDKHFNHVHFSARYETRAESDTRPWGVYVPGETAEEIPVEQKTFNALMDGWAKTPNGKAALASVLDANIGSTAVPTRTVREFFKDVANQLRPAWVFPMTHKENVSSGLPTDAPIRGVLALPARVSAIESKLTALTKQ